MRPHFGQLVALLPLLAFAFSAPVPDTNALEARLPPNPPIPSECFAPMVQCPKACCAAKSTCSGNGLCVPWVPKIGTLTVSHYTDSEGMPGMIAITGTGFLGTADVLIQVWTSTTIIDVFIQTNVGGPDWYIKTGVQDCLQDGSATEATDGDVAYVWASDNYLTTYYDYETDTPRVPVRANPNSGYCPQLLRIPITPIDFDIGSA